MIFLAFPYYRPLPKGQWAVAYVRATNYHKLILMQATAERAIGGGFRRNSDSELKLKNRCTGSTCRGISWLHPRLVCFNLPPPFFLFVAPFELPFRHSTNHSPVAQIMQMAAPRANTCMGP